MIEETKDRRVMTAEIKGFVEYLEQVKEASRNTVVSYQRDLMQLEAYLKDQGITEVGKVTKTSLNSYILELEKEGKPRPRSPGSWPPSRPFFIMPSGRG